MIGGSLGRAGHGRGAVELSGARVGGKVFLLNNVEYATAQLWVCGDAGNGTLADLKGR